MKYHQKITLCAALAAAFAAPASANSFFLVVPVASRGSAAVDPALIQVELFAQGMAVGKTTKPYSHSFRNALQITGDPYVNLNQAAWSITSGSLPAGLSLSASGAVSGTPTTPAAGTPFEVNVAYKGKSATQSYSIPVVEMETVALSPLTLAAGIQGTPYVASLAGATSVTGGPGAASVNYTVTSGALPAGVSLSSSGAISGTPSAATPAGGTNFTVNAAYLEASAQRSYNIFVDEARMPGLFTAATETTFRNAVIGEGVTRSFNFSNNGNTSAPGLVPFATGPGWSIDTSTCGTAGAPGNLAVGASCSFVVRWSPEVAGLATGTVGVNWTGPAAGSHSLAISGSAKVDYSELMAGYTKSLVITPANAVWNKNIPWLWKISTASSDAPAETLELRQIITVPGNYPINAVLHGAVDDILRSASVNGAQVLADEPMPHTSVTASPEFTLQPGLNVLAVRVENAGGPAGVSLRVKTPELGHIASADAWRMQ